MKRRIINVLRNVLITVPTVYGFISVWGCVIGLYFLNFLVLSPIIIGDPEKYDNDGIKTGKLFDLFYEISSNTGYNCEPSSFNVYFTVCLGVILGGYVAFRWSKRIRKE